MRGRGGLRCGAAPEVLPRCCNRATHVAHGDTAEAWHACYRGGHGAVSRRPHGEARRSSACAVDDGVHSPDQRGRIVSPAGARPNGGRPRRAFFIGH